MRISIDDRQVNRLAEFFRTPPFADAFYQEIMPQVSAPTDSVVSAVLWAAAICHNTKGGLCGTFDGRTYHGWDYLLRAFCAIAEREPTMLVPSKMLEMDGHLLHHLLSVNASDGEISLRDIDNRAALIQRLASQILSEFDGQVLEILARSRGFAGGPTGAYNQLAKLDAFQDPLRKKSSVFLMGIHFARIWTAGDQGELFPMIDYHRLRLLCRLGCLVINDNAVLADLVAQRPVESDVEVEMRNLAFTVCKRIVELSGTPMFEFDMLLWAHARSCCRHKPVCIGQMPEDSSFYRFISKPFVGRCEFQDWCAGYRDESVRAIWEPIVSTEHY